MRMRALTCARTIKIAYVGDAWKKSQILDFRFILIARRSADEMRCHYTE